MTDTPIPLFSYGTLQQPEVQLGTFGRLLSGRPDTLAGYVLAPLIISSADVVALSGAEVHTIARRTRRADDLVHGVVLEVTAGELAAADAYETDAYARVEAVLLSGRRAYVYVGPAV